MAQRKRIQNEGPICWSNRRTLAANTPAARGPACKDRRVVARFPDAALAVAKQAVKRHPNDNVYRGELGGVQFYLGQYREAIENVAPAAAEGPSASSAMAGFWLAMSHHHQGERDKAHTVFRRAVRNWKASPPLFTIEESLIRSLWTEAAALLGHSEPRVE